MTSLSTENRIALRWRIASAYSENFWVKAVAELRQFQRMYEEAQRLPKMELASDEAQKLLSNFAFRKEGTAPSFGDTAFNKWSQAAFVGFGMDDPEAFRPHGSATLAVADGKVPVSKFLDGLELYAKALQKVLDAAGDASFTYSGFSVRNEYRMSDEKCRKMLEGVDYLTALFKKRGLTDVFKENVKAIELVPDIDDAAGLYHIHAQTITLSGSTLGKSTGRFIGWVNEVFLHEFGHHIHLTVLPREAREAWNQGWDEVKAQQEALDATIKTVSKAERVAFFNLLLKSDWDPSKAAKKLEPLARLKFGVWLRSPMTGGPLIADKQFRLTKDGQSVATFFRDPAKVVKDRYDLSPGDEGYEQSFSRIDRQMRDKIGLLYDGGFPVSKSIVDDLLKADPALQKSVTDAIDKLDIVSQYGKTNHNEDFAESFVAFLAAPEKLTSTAKFRMQRTLSLSGLYGKEIMKLAQSGKLFPVGR